MDLQISPVYHPQKQNNILQHSFITFMGPRKPCLIGKALGKRTDLLHVSPMSSKTFCWACQAPGAFILCIPHTWIEQMSQRNASHNFSVAHSPMYNDNELWTAACHWKCGEPCQGAVSLCLLHRTALCQKPFRPETLHSTASTAETSTHIWGYWARSTPAWSGAGVPFVPLKQEKQVSPQEPVGTGATWEEV